MMAPVTTEIRESAPAAGGVPSHTCEVCHREVEQCLRLELTGEIVELCGWNCLVGYAEVQANSEVQHLREGLESKTRECAELDELLTLHEAGVF
jgi:hypothetical protein